MFKIIKKCPLCGSKKKTKIIGNNRNIYSYFLSKILNLNENFILKNMQNYKCANCELIYKKNGFTLRALEEFTETFSQCILEDLILLKKTLGKKSL